MKNSCIFVYNFLLNKIQQCQVSKIGLDSYLKDRTFLNKKIFNAQETNSFIADKINSSSPFLVSRLGGVELSFMRNYEFEIKLKYKDSINHISNNAGFFPKNVDLGYKFLEIMCDSIYQIDLLGLFKSSFEQYFVKKYSNSELQFTSLFDLEPWRLNELHWSSALEGKKVLVIHPLAETISKQYEKRDKLFLNTDILPQFDLKTLKAVQTIAGQVDKRFNTWFEALDWMTDQALKIDFDIAIIGCGAYGLPLAANLKKAGKQAIHLGGATQLLFGIKGKRWVEGEYYQYVQKYFNDDWIYPLKKDIPYNAKNVEDGCYW